MTSDQARSIMEAMGWPWPWYKNRKFDAHYAVALAKSWKRAMQLP
jgi:hypothetical protein